MSRLISVCAARSHAMKPCSDGASSPLVVERELEELVERVGSLGPEPAQELCRPPAGPSSQA